MTPDPPAVFSEQVLRRIYGEFLEMPGLRLTRKQAQRLWGLDEETCIQILEFLVEAKFLRRSSRSGADSYGRLTDGSTVLPRFRMAKAQLDQKLPETNSSEHRSRSADSTVKTA
jgi:hypothetical protein